jgi:hypothetical protein
MIIDDGITATAMNPLTDSMVLSPPWEADNSSATQEIRRILCNLVMYYRIYNNPPLIPVLSQMNPVHTLPLYLLKIHFNVIFLPISRSS